MSLIKLHPKCLIDLDQSSILRARRYRHYETNELYRFWIESPALSGHPAGGELSSVAKVSALYDVSRNHMVKVVNQLVKLGYLQSQRGKNGGIRMARSPTRSISGK